MAVTHIKLYSWGPLERDDNGHRAYSVTIFVRTDSYDDGPATIIQAPGLPAVGSTWAFKDDVDVYAYCTPWARVYHKLEGEGEGSKVWYVDLKFTTRSMIRCNDGTIENPLDEPPMISGGFNPYREEAIFDRHGDLLLMSSMERMTGPEVEIEKGRPVIQISFNVSELPLADFSEMLDKGAVNDSTLWGLPARCVRLAEVTWQRYLYGVCTYYYRINYVFEVKFESWNRYIVDMGTKVKELDTEPISSTNPLITFNNPLTGKPDKAFLDGSGNAVYLDQGAPLSNVWIWEKELEYEYNFLLLDIPSSL
jgi:hypothetical protein